MSRVEGYVAAPRPARSPIGDAPVNTLPFKRREPRRPTLLQRLLGRRPAENALIELVNTLAELPRPDIPEPGLVDEIGQRHGIELRARFSGELEELYRGFLLHCLADRRFSREESEAAGRLARLLGVSAPRCVVIHRQVARKVYLRTLEEVLADGAVDPEERAFLAQLQTHLGIPEDQADNMMELRRKQLGL